MEQKRNKSPRETMLITDVIGKMIDYFQNDVRRINHALKVYGFALILSRDINASEETKQVIFLTALLHDIGIKEAERKYQSAGGRYQEIEGPSIARTILSQCPVSLDIIDRVCFIIGNHHSYSMVDGIDFQIVIEADFLVNFFEDSMNHDAIRNISKKLFKTQTGKKILKTMYFSDEPGDLQQQ